MFNQKLVSTAILVALSISTNSHATEEWQLNRLQHPSFVELQSEAVYQTITCYEQLSEDAIEEALDTQFERIQYMSFDECNCDKKEVN